MCDLLRREIVSADPQLKLPSEYDLVRSFGVSRNAIREALDLLRQEGLLERVPGAGTFPSERAMRHRLDLAQNFTESLFGSDLLERCVLVTEQRKASPPLARGLEVEPGDEVLLVERVAKLHGTPLFHATCWFPGFIAERFLATDLRRETSDILTSLGLALGHAEFSLAAVVAGDADAEALEVEIGAPLMLLGLRIRLVDGRPVEFSFARLRSDRMEIVPSLLTLGLASLSSP